MVRKVAVLTVVLALCPASLFGQRLLGKDKMFVRFTNIRPDAAKVMVRLHVHPNHHKPFGWGGKTIYVGHDGEGGPDGSGYLSVGQASPWVDVGQYMNRQGTRSWETYLSPLLCGVMTSPQSDGLYLLTEVAEGRGTRVIRRLEIRKPELPAKGTDYPWHLGYGTWLGGPKLPTVGLLVPARPDLGPRVYTLAEALNWQLEAIKGFPDVGRVPSRFVFKTRAQRPIFDALGYRGYPPDTVEGNFGDEIHIHLKMPKDEQNRRFREHLQAKGLSPRDLIREEDWAKARELARDQRWGLVTIDPLMDERGEAVKPIQFYESANFRYQLWYEELRTRTKKFVADRPGKRVLTGANYSPHMNVWPDVRQWVGPFKAGAMTMSWTEDWWWQLPEVSPQVYGFLLDGLRLAGSYHGAPIQYYIMPFRGSSADNIRRMHGLALAHGAKIINHFVTDTQVTATWDYIDVTESPRTFQAIHDMIRGIGAVEHRLYPAMPAKAQVAIMLSRACDTWDTEDLGGSGHLYSARFNVNNDERKALWMALRHAQCPVDLILDEDIAEGRLEDYRVLYIVGAEMLAAAAEPLKRWVEQGGIVYATGGGGLLDEYHRSQTSLYQMYGIKGHRLVREVRHIRPRSTLPKAQPLDIVRIRPADSGLPAIEMPALLYRETLDPAEGARIVGRYKSDGACAAVLAGYGKGRTIYLGALAGMAYLTPAMPPSSRVLPTDFPGDRRALITAPIRWAGIVPPVATSDPLVEAQYMVGTNGPVVVLTNWRQHPVDELVVRFPGLRHPERVRSLAAAGYFSGHLHEQSGNELEVEIVDGTGQVRTRLEVIDFLLVD